MKARWRRAETRPSVGAFGLVLRLGSVVQQLTVMPWRVFAERSIILAEPEFTPVRVWSEVPAPTAALPAVIPGRLTSDRSMMPALPPVTPVPADAARCAACCAALNWRTFFDANLTVV